MSAIIEEPCRNSIRWTKDILETSKGTLLLGMASWWTKLAFYFSSKQSMAMQVLENTSISRGAFQPNDYSDWVYSYFGDWKFSDKTTIQVMATALRGLRTGELKWNPVSRGGGGGVNSLRKWRKFGSLIFIYNLIFLLIEGRICQ